MFSRTIVLFALTSGGRTGENSSSFRRLMVFGVNMLSVSSSDLVITMKESVIDIILVAYISFFR